MNLSDFIRKLQEIESQGKGDLPVVLEDWTEGYATASEEICERISVCDIAYWPTDTAHVRPVKGEAVCIGRN